MARGGLSLVLLAAAALAGCGSTDGAADVVFIDEPESLFGDGVRLSAGAQHVRAATEAGLVPRSPIVGSSPTMGAASSSVCATAPGPTATT